MTDIVMVPVPVSRLQDVYELLAGDERWEEPVLVPEVKASAQESRMPRLAWTGEMIAQFMDETSPDTQSVILAIAQTDEAQVTTEFIADETGFAARKVVALLGPLQRRLQGWIKPDMEPLYHSRRGYDGRVKYWMPAEHAEMVLSWSRTANANKR